MASVRNADLFRARRVCRPHGVTKVQRDDIYQKYAKLFVQRVVRVVLVATLLNHLLADGGAFTEQFDQATSPGTRRIRPNTRMAAPNSVGGIRAVASAGIYEDVSAQDNAPDHLAIENYAHRVCRLFNTNRCEIRVDLPSLAHAQILIALPSAG